MKMEHWEKQSINGLVTGLNGLKNQQEQARCRASRKGMENYTGPAHGPVKVVKNV